MSVVLRRFGLFLKRTVRPVFWVLLAIPFIPSPSESAIQKEESSEETTLRVGVNLVTVGVLVTHGKGSAQARLQAGDFILHEEGKPQKLSFFSSEEQPDGLADRSHFRSHWIICPLISYASAHY